MCAAPGSKTAQLIELLHAEDGTLPSMLLVRSTQCCVFILFCLKPAFLNIDCVILNALSVIVICIISSAIKYNFLVVNYNP
jgi:hypothetical protein